MAKLLHPKMDTIDTSFYFPVEQKFWDRLVQLASTHLVLPAIYGAMNRKNISHHAPNELIVYLKEISDLNFSRNSAILKQIEYIAELFKKYDIEHVFLKGAALLILKPYDTTRERMVGDIDILVAEKSLLNAQKLFLSEGFQASSSKFNFSEGIFSGKKNKHLQRISHPNYIAAIELHRHLLDKKNFLIEPKDVLADKVQSSEDYWIPSTFHLWYHSILNWQYNDRGLVLNSLSFRSVNDVFFLEPMGDVKKLRTSHIAIKHYYNLISVHYNYYSLYSSYRKFSYAWKLNFKAWRRLCFIFSKLKYFSSNFLFFICKIFNRFFLIIISKKYRKRVLYNPKLFVQRVLDFWNK